MVTPKLCCAPPLLHRGPVNSACLLCQKAPRRVLPQLRICKRNSGGFHAGVTTVLIESIDSMIIIFQAVRHAVNVLNVCTCI